MRVDNEIGACRAHRNGSDSRKAYIKQYATDNNDELKAYRKEYRTANSDKLNADSNRRYHNDIPHRIRAAIRNRLNTSLKRRKQPRIASAIEFLGCTVEFLKQHLESKFKSGMSWENHGRKGWHIDHILPLASFDLTNPIQFKKANHYTNLQPLWATENIVKRDRIESAHECSTTKKSG